jgi:hypothetical protein
MIRLSDKTGEVFCAASCTFSPTQGMLTQPHHQSANFNLEEQTVGAEVARQTTRSRPDVLLASAKDYPLAQPPSRSD